MSSQTNIMNAIFDQRSKRPPEGGVSRWHRTTDGHGDSMTNSAQWGRVGENDKHTPDSIPLVDPGGERRSRWWWTIRTPHQGLHLGLLDHLGQYLEGLGNISATDYLLCSLNNHKLTTKGLLCSLPLKEVLVSERVSHLHCTGTGSEILKLILSFYGD